MEKTTLALIFLSLAIACISGSLLTAVGQPIIPQISIQLLALGFLFLCLFAICLALAVMELKVIVKSMTAPPAFR